MSGPVLVKPAFQSALADSGDATKLGPNSWNAARLFSGGVNGEMLVRDTASATGASWTTAGGGGGSTTDASLLVSGTLADARLSANVVTAASATALTNKTGAISQWTNDASYTTLAAVAGVGYLTAAGAAALTNKTGAISQWTNDSGYLTAITPGGSTTQVQFHNAGVLGGDARLTWAGRALFVGPDALLTGGANNVIGVFPSAQTITIESTISGGDQVAALKSQTLADPASHGNARFGGTEFGVVTKDGNTHDFNQLYNYFAAFHQGSGTAQFVRGVFADAEVFAGSSGLGHATDVSALVAYTSVDPGAATNAHGLLVFDVAGATNNYAIKTGLGLVSLGDAVTITGTVTAANLSGTNTGDQNLSAYVTLTGAQALTNKTGAISQWTNDASYTTLAAVAGVGYATATSATAFTNKTGAISQWTNDSSFTTLAAVAGVGYATATSATAFTNKTGNISQWTNDSSFTTLAAVAGVGYLTSVTAHALLSATHSDTLAAAVARGSLILGNSTPKWSALAIGTVGKVLQSDGTDVSWATPTGTGTPVLATSPTLVTPLLGTPTSGVATNLTGTAAGLTAGTVTTNANLTGPITSAGNATAIAAQTGTGTTFVMNTSPTLVTPVLGVAAGTSLVLTEAVGASALTLTGATQVTSFPVLTATQTWNASGTTFTAAKLNVTSTASATASLLLDLQVGAASKLNVRKDGTIISAASTNGGLALQGGGTVAAYLEILGESVFVTNGTILAAINRSSVRGFSTTWGGSYAWGTSTTNANGSGADLFLYRDAAATLALRNATTAQKFRLYNTFTTVDTAGEWWKQDWITTANQFRMGAVKGSSTGTARVASWDYGAAEASPTAAITVPITSGNIVFGGGVQLSNAAVTGLTAGVLAGTTNASIVLYDSGGQAYRVPCII